MKTQKHTSSLTIAADYLTQIVVVLFWALVLRIACLCSREIRTANASGERMDHVDDSIDRLNILHVELFGSEECPPHRPSPLTWSQP
jgi:hypothetical protein